MNGINEGPANNETFVMYFIIKGISDDPELQMLVFFLVLLIYLITLGGNLIIFLLVCLDHQLHTPMYFFLVNLSTIDMSSITVTLHKVLISFISGNNTISFVGCMTQFYLFASLTIDELLVLTAMSYDRYIAICNPLNYHMIMNPRVCGLLAIVSWSWGFIEMLPHIVILSHFSFSKSREINHFFCDILPLLKLSCTDPSFLYLLIFVSGLFHTCMSFFLTFIPYIFIIKNILRIRSRTGRSKGFYTCSSHLTVIGLLYMTLIFLYLKPTSMGTLDSSKVFSLFNTAAVPMLNPLIYSLKNKDVKAALRRRVRWYTTII
ncbi:olfactory receptor 8B8-like [Discoglossus pictus]